MFCASQIACLAQNNLSSFEDRMICGFSEDNVIFSSRDGGSSWSECDFNREYDGYYPRLDFRSIAAGNTSFAVLGLDSQSSPHLFISTEGKVWSERELSWLEHGSPVFLQAEPQELLYDAERDQFILKCSDGYSLILPPCSHCNQRVESSVLVYYL